MKWGNDLNPRLWTSATNACDATTSGNRGGRRHVELQGEEEVRCGFNMINTFRHLRRRLMHEDPRMHGPRDEQGRHLHAGDSSGTDRVPSDAGRRLVSATRQSGREFLHVVQEDRSKEPHGTSWSPRRCFHSDRRNGFASWITWSIARTSTVSFCHC